MLEQLKNNNSLCKGMKHSEQDSLHQKSNRCDSAMDLSHYTSGILNQPASNAEFYHSQKKHTYPEIQPSLGTEVSMLKAAGNYHRLRE